MKSSSVYKLAPSKSQYGSVVHLAENGENSSTARKTRLYHPSFSIHRRMWRKRFYEDCTMPMAQKTRNFLKSLQKVRFPAQSICH